MASVSHKKKVTFGNEKKSYDQPYYVNMIDQLVYSLCPSCRPDEFELYHIKHDTPRYQLRCVLDCVCGREATLDNILYGCSHCTCIDNVTQNELYIAEKNKISIKLKKDYIKFQIK